MHRGGPPHTPHAKSCQCRPARLFVRAATACLLTKVQDQRDVLEVSARKCVWCREGRVARNVRHLIKTRLHLGVCGRACFTPPYGCVSRSLQTVHTHFGPEPRLVQNDALPLLPRLLRHATHLPGLRPSRLHAAGLHQLPYHVALALVAFRSLRCGGSCPRLLAALDRPLLVVSHPPLKKSRKNAVYIRN